MRELADVIELAREAGISGIALSNQGRVIVHGPRIPFKVYRRLRKERKVIQQVLEGTARPFLEVK